MNPGPAGCCLASIDVLVLAGGQGTRVRAVLGDTPKLLAPIAGQPYLAYLLDWLARFGARRVLLALGFGAAAVVDYLGGCRDSGLAVETVIEPEALGTAGAVRFARPALRSDPVMVMNGDSFVDADLCAFVDHHRQADALGTLLCTEVEDTGRYGRVVVDRGSRIQGFLEKSPDHQGPGAVSAGVYLLSARLLNEIAASTASSLEKDIFEQLSPGSLAAFVGRYGFIDIGTPESLAGAADVLAPAAGRAAASTAGHASS